MDHHHRGTSKVRRDDGHPTILEAYEVAQNGEGFGQGSGQSGHGRENGPEVFTAGKAYPVTGDSNADARSYRMINKNTLALTNKKGGKATLTGRVVVSRDGKTRTVTTTARDAKGKKVTNVAVYDKQ